MTYEGTQFTLHLRCLNCEKDTARQLIVPPGADAPTTVDELMISAELERYRFSCQQCDSAIGTITAVTMPKMKRAA